MTENQPLVTTFDMDRLSNLIKSSRIAGYQQKFYLKQLNEELEKAKVVNPQDIPKNIITMNSTVRIRDLSSGEKKDFTLVFPSDARIEEGKISILSAVGIALIGYRVGDVIEWQVPSGLKRLKIEQILYQPEASGHYDR